MRFRAQEWMEKRGVNPYALAQASSGRISQTAAYRLWRGEKEHFSLDELDALCEVLDVEPAELFERERAAGKTRRGRG